MNATAMADQLQAAYRDTRRITELLGDFHGMTQWLTEIPDWVREQFEAIATKVNDNTITVCRHLASPQPAFAAVWKPDHITCGRCADRLNARGMEDHTCDRCRRIVMPIFPGVVAKGALTLQFGLCRRCTDEVGLPRAPLNPSKPTTRKANP